MAISAGVPSDNPLRGRLAWIAVASLADTISPYMKLTLNSAVPLEQRRAVEQLVSKLAPNAVICWLPSRFPRLVMLVEPDLAATERVPGGSIFDDGELRGVGDFSAELENSIQQLLRGTAAK